MLKIFYSNILDGNMNMNQKFYPEYMTKEDIKKDFKLRRQLFGERNNFDGLKIIVPSQKSNANPQNNYKDGHYERITPDMINGYEDLYDLDIYADILMIDDKLPNIALAYPSADCPIIFATDKIHNVTAMAHCGAEYIDRELPSQIIDALRQETDVLPEYIDIYVGPHGKKESYAYDCYPKWAKNPSIWENAIVEEKDNLLHIDMEKAILKQLYNQNLHPENITICDIDTIKNPLYYSNSAARYDQNKAGRFYQGCIYQKTK